MSIQNHPRHERNTNSPAAPASVALQALACAAVLVLCAPVVAQSSAQDSLYGLSGSIGIGVSTTHTYEGSPNRRTLAGPDFTLSYRTQDWGSLELGQRGLVWQAVEVDDFKVGLAAGFDPGRKAKDTSAGDPTPGDKRLAGMGDVRASAEGGVIVGYGPLSLLARRSIGDRGHKGAQVDVTVEFPLALTQTVGVRFGAGLAWADKRFTQAYFGVTPEQALASGFRAYTPKAGVRKFELSAGAEYAFSDWKLQGSLTLTRLTGDAADSPLVERKSSPSASLGVAYAF
jgi:MipA family protein